MPSASIPTTPRELAEHFQAETLAASPFTASMYGIPGYDDKVPDASPEGEARWRSTLEATLGACDDIDGAGLALQDAITLDVTRDTATRELIHLDAAEGEHTVTPMPFSGPAVLLAVAARTVITDEQAASDYVTRLRASGDYLDQLSDRLREGAAKGRLPVRPLVEQAIAWADDVLAQPVPEALRTPQPPAGWDGESAWRDDVAAAAAESVKPALARWRELLAGDLLDRARSADQAGLVHLPGGEEDYAGAIRIHTTLPRTAEELHQTGLDHVAQLEERALALGAEIGLHDLAAIHDALRASAEGVDPTEAMAQAQEAVRRAESRAADVFPAPLPPPCVVSPMPPVVAASGMAPHYTPPRLDGGRPGTYWFNTQRPTAGAGWDLEAVSFHEAVPGHHLQLSRIQLLSDLPSLQRQRSVTVFSEGWGLYAEQLADEQGLYSGPREQLGAVTASLMRAVRLVVDTGMHAFGWSRDAALDFYVAHVPLPRQFLANEIDRYIIMPGQALAYLTGKIEILRLRDEARASLGTRFELPAFHAAVLDSGSLPMPVLERKITAWAAA